MKSEWISVKERFPTKEEQDQRIIVYFPESDLMGIQPKYCYIGPSDPYPYGGPSYWMPAPSPPIQ